MEYIKVYSPVDGVIDSITKCDDKAFSDKLLGDGFYVIPDNGNFGSIFDKANILMIFETKHAFFLESLNGPKVMYHVGLDTVKLKGKPFKYIKNVGQLVNKSDLILEVDLELIKSNNLSLQTPIVFDLNENINYKFNLTKTGKVKIGEEIGYFEKLKKQNFSNDKLVSKFEEAALSINELVGKEFNYSNYYNCMTRLRFDIIDKSLVNEQELKKIPIVKGINWSGHELQIIIGGNVLKVKEVFDKKIKIDNKVKFETLSKNKKVKDKILAFLSGVVTPTLPIILAAGILMAIKSIFIETKLIQDIKNYEQMKTASVFSAFMYITAELGIGMLGIFFCISTVKYLKGNIVVGAMVGIAIASPYLFWGISYTLFDWGFIKIKLGGYYNSIIPQVVAGAIYVYADKWVKSWMPTAVDICFRTALSFIITMISVMFILGPILGVLEGLIGKGVIFISDAPFGIGTMLFAILWQPLVLTGMHVPVIMAVIQNLPNSLYAASAFGIFGQLGAALCVGMTTNNYKVKEVAYSSMPAAVVGITEPIIYGITLPRLVPFLIGCLGAGIAGLVTGLLKIQGLVPGGMGLLGITRFIPGGAYQISLFFLGTVISICCSYLLTFILFKEKRDEISLIKSNNKLLVKYLVKFNNLNKEDANKLLKSLSEKILVTKDNKKLIKNCKIYFTKLSRLETKLNHKNDIDNEKIIKLNIEIDQLKSKAKNIKVVKLTNLLTNIQNKNKEKYYEEKINNINLDYKFSKESFIKFQDKFMNNVNDLINDLKDKQKNEKIELIKNNYFNSIHELDIIFQYTEKKDKLLNLSRKQV
ncbi:PTS glucose transporter subunit IIABC [Spiroplasma turonicum]|uniref:PTS system beta-glucoside-specific IIABC component n=1 Tax=Spiroplasma turonicum TaxID=216946 RepID=A0A0K1P6E2_9MOLU|nr:PTS glucose transporter subunit IIABC [Spiroplasma turonicum]AKU79886.1 PTS system beta-glucoside-specific IIABC component [Spiroplasma turonicum]ALX70897.1 PTS system, beta-glucosides-specific IIC component [Spiroplasma turonicum]